MIGPPQVNAIGQGSSFRTKEQYCWLLMGKLVLRQDAPSFTWKAYITYNPISRTIIKMEIRQTSMEFHVNKGLTN